MDNECYAVDGVLADVKRFVGRTFTSFLFVEQEDGEEERLVKVVPFQEEHGHHHLGVEEVYKEAVCRR